MDPNEPAPAWVPLVALAIPACIMVALGWWAVRSRAATRRSRRAERGRLREAPSAGAGPRAIDDPARYSADALLDALRAAPDSAPAGSDDDSGDWTGNAAALGLRSRVAAASEVMEPTVYYGTLRGRQVFVRLGPDEAIEGGTTMLSNRHVRTIVVLRVAAPDFTLGATGGRPVVRSGDERVRTVTDSLAPAADIWDDVIVRGGANGIVVARPLIGDATVRGWLDGLWLAERIADALDLPALPDARLGPSWTVPYELGRRTTLS